MNIKTYALPVAVALGMASGVASADATELLAVLDSNATTFMEDTKDILFAGAGLIIGALLVSKLVQLVIGFFRGR